MTDLLALVAGRVGDLADLANLATEVALFVWADHTGQRPHRRILFGSSIGLLEYLCFDFVLGRG
jgi:hypothetical protein